MFNTADPFLKLKWIEGKRAATAMRRAVNAVVARNLAFFRPWGKETIHVYDLEHDNWYEVPECLYVYSSLAHVCNVLITIGGEKDEECTDKLLSLTWKTKQPWEEVLPHMPTKRKNSVSTTAGTWLVVSGGIQAGRYLTLVELLNLESNTWSSVATLPEAIFNAAVTFGGGYIYMLGGNKEPGFPTTTVISCKLDHLVRSSTGDTTVWKKLTDLPVERSSCVCIRGQLLAIGGQYRNTDTIATMSSTNSHIHVCSSVYQYSSMENTWNIVSDLTTSVSECFAAVLPGDKLMVLGGNTRQGVTDKVLFGTLDMSPLSLVPRPS